jgi:hypothetical protein
MILNDFFDKCGERPVSIDGGVLKLFDEFT